MENVFLMLTRIINISFCDISRKKPNFLKGPVSQRNSNGCRFVILDAKWLLKISINKYFICLYILPTWEFAQGDPVSSDIHILLCDKNEATNILKILHTVNVYKMCIKIY